MARKRTGIGKFLLLTLVFVLVCGIVSSEFPELLSLTDNATNDFTISRTKSPVLPVVPGATRPVRVGGADFSAPAPNLVFSRRDTLEAAALVPSDLFILHSVFRT
jgi:hypothetical protein